MLNVIIRYCLENRLIAWLLLVLFLCWGLVTAPFGWQTGLLPHDPVAVDAIPDIGENQQIVFTQWPGRSPQDIEDQISYPLTTSLLGIPGVKSIRSSSILGFSSIYIIFNEDIEFYWSRSRILEKLNSLPAGLLPEGVQPSLGPDATALGQVYWYTLEGRDSLGNPTGGWDLHEVRSVQDFYVKYALSSVDGVAEVASIGGYAQEYQIDVRPEALRDYNIPLHHVVRAVRNANRDAGAKTIEINQAEYLVRGLGYIKSIEDIEKAVVAVNNNVPIRIGDVALVTLGPANRRGMLDKDGAEVVGGVVVARYGANPLAVISALKHKIAAIGSGLPRKTLADGSESQLTIVPFYDRTQLIEETLGTLEEALSLEILITLLVVIVLVTKLKAAVLIASLLPVAVLMVFIAMRYFGVDANIVALSGIAIAIGTMIDLGIILTENILKHLKEQKGEKSLLATIYSASAEVSSAIVAAVSTTIVSFIPVFTMEAAEGKLFRPLAFTKTFALIAALIVALLILPALAHWLFGLKIRRLGFIRLLNAILIAGGILISIAIDFVAGSLLIAFGVTWFLRHYLPRFQPLTHNFSLLLSVIAVCWLLASYWLPLGAGRSPGTNFAFVALLLSGILLPFYTLERLYSRLLAWCLRNKGKFLLIPGLIVLSGMLTWLGFARVFGFIATGADSFGADIRSGRVWSGLTQSFPGIGKEFMPALDEGSFLLMPSSMPHAGFEQNKTVVQQLDMLVAAIPEVELVVGKMGRAETALDPAPISMYENIVNYKPEYLVNDKGLRLRFQTDDDGRFILRSGDTLANDEILQRGMKRSDLLPDESGRYFRNWRAAIRSPEDIWNAIVQAADLPGVTSAPKLQPIETRLVMLQTGMRAPMGIKVYGPDLASIEDFGLKLEAILKEVPSVKSEAVFADRIVGKPYIHLNIDRDAIARYGLSVEDLQRTIETAIGGMKIGNTVEGRERYTLRVRYPRELRDDPASLRQIYVATPAGAQVPLTELVAIEYLRGPQMIKSEDTFLVGYVLLDKKDGYAEVDVVDDAQQFIRANIDQGRLVVPPGVSYKFSGSYENQIRAEKRLGFIIPLVLAIILLILYFQFRSLLTSLMVFAGIALAFSGGFLMIWLYGQSWFADIVVLGVNLRDLFHIETINLSVAVWVGFIALFGITTDNGVLIATYLDQSFARNSPASIAAIRHSVVEAGQRRIKPALMTAATTLIALLPVLSSSGRGADIMIPMAIPTFGGMLVALISVFLVPLLYCMREERRLIREQQ